MTFFPSFTQHFLFFSPLFHPQTYKVTTTTAQSTFYNCKLHFTTAEIVIGCTLKYALSCGSRIIKVKVKAEPVDIVIIQVYMPTTNHEEEEVENMYERLEEVLDRTKGTDYVVKMGDWNAVVGEGADGKSIGKYGLGRRNNRGEKLTELCNRRELVITNT